MERPNVPRTGHNILKETVSRGLTAEAVRKKFETKGLHIRSCVIGGQVREKVRFCNLLFKVSNLSVTIEVGNIPCTLMEICE